MKERKKKDEEEKKDEEKIYINENMEEKNRNSIINIGGEER